MHIQQREIRCTKLILIVSGFWLGVLGAGVQNQYSKTFSWGVSAEYAYGGTLDVDKQSATPVALGGRGDLVGSFPDTGIFFLAINFKWVF